MPEIDLPNVDSLFKLSTNKGKTETIVMIPIEEILDFPNHPYKVRDDEDMKEMAMSVKEYGVLMPVIVRPIGNGNYQMISGHRRKRACKLADKKEMPCIVRELTDDEAIILMVDSNVQREKVLPSEKAFAYKMKMEALSHQGKKETSRQAVEKLVSADLVGQESGESGRQVQRFIRLTELKKELLDLVDEGKIAFSPAVEVSYLNSDEQYVLLSCINEYQATPSQAQAIHLKKLSQEGKLTAEKIEDIIGEEKPNQKPKYKINYNRFEKYLPRDVVTEKEVEDFLLTCVEEHYRRQMQKQRGMAR